MISSKFLAKANGGKAARLETMPDDLSDDVKEAVGAYERESEET